MSSPQLSAIIEAATTVVPHQYPHTVTRRIRVAVIQFGGYWFYRLTDLDAAIARDFDPSIVPFQSRRSAFLAGINAVLTNVRDQVEAIVDVTTDD